MSEGARTPLQCRAEFQSAPSSPFLVAAITCESPHTQHFWAHHATHRMSLTATCFRPAHRLVEPLDSFSSRHHSAYPIFGLILMAQCDYTWESKLQAPPTKSL